MNFGTEFKDMVNISEDSAQLGMGGMKGDIV